MSSRPSSWLGSEMMASLAGLNEPDKPAAPAEPYRDRLDVLETSSQEMSRILQDMSGTMESLTSELRAVMSGLGTFTGEVTRLSRLTESRNQVYFLDQTLERDYGLHASVRTSAAAVFAAAGGPAWPEIRDGALACCTPLARNYWLAAAGLALIAWIGDSRHEADKRSMEAMLADPAAAPLFLCLAAHRLGREEAASAWAGQYFSARDPSRTDADAASLFLTACDGALGSAVRKTAVSAAGKWTAAEAAAFSPEADDLGVWENFLRVNSITQSPAEAFPLLREHCPQWDQLRAGCEWTGLQAGMTALYRGLVSGETSREEDAPGEHGGPAPEAILDRVIGRYADTEKGLRMDRLRAAILIEESGSLEAAEERMLREWPEEKGPVSFSAFLARILTGVRPVPARTGRLARALAFPWLELAYSKMRGELSPPAEADIAIGDWTGRTAAGANASELLASFSRHLDETESRQAGVKWLDEKLILPAGLLVVLTLITASTIIIPVLALGGFGYLFYHRLNIYEKEKDERERQADQRRRDGMDLLTNCLNELRTFRKMTADQNREADSAREMMRAFDPVRVFDGARADSRAAETGAAGTALPAWNLLPPA